MFKLLPQLIVIISIATIILIILRRLPQVIIRQESGSVGASPETAGTRRVVIFVGKIKNWLVSFYKCLASFVAEAKSHTNSSNYLERFSRALHFKSLKSQLRKPTGEVSEHLSEAADHIKNSNLESAEQSLLEIIKEDPGNKDAYEGLGKLYIDQKKFFDALEVYLYLTKKHPDIDKFFSRLGLIYFNLGKYDESIKAYQQSIDLKPDSPNRLINLSLCYEAKKQTEKAVEAVEKALILSPDNPKYMLLLSDFLVTSGKKELAKKLLEKVLELEPTNDSARDKLRQLKF